MKRLSARALSYLERMSRDKEWFCSKEETVNYLDTLNFGLIKPLARFESDYSGYNLKIRGASSENFFLRLFSVNDVRDNSEIIYFDYNHRKLFECGYHQTAQYNFYIDNLGQILVEISDEYYLELYSSVEIMIEIYAMLDSFDPMIYRSNFYQIKDSDYVLLKLFYEGFNEVKDCCDNQNQILKNGDITVYVRPFWDEGNRKGLQVWGLDKTQCELLIDSFKMENLLFV